MGLDELILVVPRGRLLPPGGLDGFSVSGVDAYVERIRRHGDFRRRGDVEEDSSLKQIIPYLIIRYRERIFLFQRSTRGGEERLHGLYSIGVGGPNAPRGTHGGGGRAGARTARGTGERERGAGAAGRRAERGRHPGQPSAFRCGVRGGDR